MHSSNMYLLTLLHSLNMCSYSLGDRHDFWIRGHGHWQHFFQKKYDQAIDAFLEWRKSSLQGVNFTWIENDDRYDFVAGIAYDGQPIGTGAWIRPSVVVTSAAVQGFIDQGNWEDKLTVSGIAGFWHQRRSYKVACYTTMNRKHPWIKHGDKSHYTYQHPPSHVIDHSPAHDIYMLTVDYIPFIHPALPRKFAGNRYPFIIKVAHKHFTLYPAGYTFAAFGYSSEAHIEKSLDLEMEQYTTDVLVDCDDYIPRRWGYFICMKNENGVLHLASGAPLLHREFLVGIGCFEFKKANDSILVFTDIRPYMSVLKLCVNVLARKGGRVPNKRFVYYNYTVADDLGDEKGDYNIVIRALSHGVYRYFYSSTIYPRHIQRIVDWYDQGGRLPLNRYSQSRYLDGYYEY